MKLSVIIPCYNEEERIVPIVEAIQSSGFDKEIIIVDDGSSEKTKQILSKFHGVKIITHEKNAGKTQALKDGFDASSGGIIVFIDSDLSNFKTKSFEKLIYPVISGQFDVSLGEPEADYLITKKIGIVVIFSGERAIRREIIENHKEIFNVAGFLFESKMNQSLFNKYKIIKVKLEGVGPCLKMKKIGIIKGIIADLRMAYSIVRFLGIKQLISQLSFSYKINYFSH